MAYCVRCGVKLQDGSTFCPLCNTQVVLPPDMVEQKERPLFSEKMPSRGFNGMNKTRKGMIELIVALFVVSELTVFMSMLFSGNGEKMFIPLFSIAMTSLSIILCLRSKKTYVTQATVLLCMIAVLLFGLDGADLRFSWSLLAAPAVLLGWVLAVLPFTRKAAGRPIATALSCILSVVAYLVLANIVLTGHLTWFAPVALPVTGTLLVLSSLFLLGFSRRRNKNIPVADVVLASLADLLLTITSLDLFLTAYQLGTFGLRWAQGLLASSILIILLLVGISVSRRIRRFFNSHSKHS